MTINMAVWRPTFVVLGADRLRSRRDEETAVAVAVGTHTKIVLHPTLPLALAVGGQAFIPVDSTTPVTDHLEAVLAQIKMSWDLSMGVLVELLKSRLDSVLPLAAIARLPES